MTEERVYPSAKPPTTAAVPPPPSTTKPHLYNPGTRHPYRPQPHHRRHNRRRFSCCCCFIWTTITILIIILLLSIIACALYVLYRPHKPTFTISSLHTQTLNLTTSPDASLSHLACLFNLTITSKNPNNHIKLEYQPFKVAMQTVHGGVEVGNGTLNGLSMMSENNATSLRVILGSSKGLDAESATSLEKDMKKKSGLACKVVMDTKVRITVGKFDSKKVGIRVTCEGIKGVVKPKSKKVASVADVKNVKCEVDLRVKIWKFTF